MCKQLKNLDYKRDIFLILSIPRHVHCEVGREGQSRVSGTVVPQASEGRMLGSWVHDGDHEGCLRMPMAMQ